MTAINQHLTATIYSQLKPGDRVVNGLLNPARPDAHLRARTVARIVGTYRATGFVDHGLTARDRFTYYDYEVIVWRDTNGSLFEDRADAPAYIATTD